MHGKDASKTLWWRGRIAGAGCRCGAGLLAAGALLAGALPPGGPDDALAMVVAPHAVFIDHRTRSGVMYLQNAGDVPEEFAIRLEFGYPVSDSLGGVYVQLMDEPPPGAGSAASWVRALPARAIVPPGTRQAVRLLAQPPRDLPDGEYWSRIIVESRASQPPVAVAGHDKVQVGLTMQMRTITSLTYRKGRVVTGLKLDAFEARAGQGEVVCDLRLQRGGNAAFLGHVDLELIDQDDHRLGHWEHVIAVYDAVFRRFACPLEGDVPPGEYRMHLTIDTERTDISADHLLPVTPIEHVIPVHLP
jgi:hypothetical protein